MSARLAAAALVLALASFAGGSTARANADVPRWKVWLCKPGLKINYCNTYLSVTAYASDGVSRRIAVPDTPNPPLDCFYVYPTVSQEQRGNADLKIQTAEKAAVIPQAARFSQVCRVFAPVYRQTTGRPGGSNELAYGDVLAAWRDYLAHDNDGRGVVLIGHSEGAFILEQLLREQGAPIRKVLVSALLLGGDVQVGRDEKFAGFPACRASSATGCIVAYSSWGATPPAGAALQDIASPSEHVLCVNPADPANRSGEAAITPIFPWVVPEGIVPGVITPNPATFWVSFPDMYTARCVQQGSRSWLLISRINHPGDPRPTVRPILSPDLGLHAADVNIALGNLISLVQAQARAWKASH